MQTSDKREKKENEIMQISLCDTRRNAKRKKGKEGDESTHKQTQAKMSPEADNEIMPHISGPSDKSVSLAPSISLSSSILMPFWMQTKKEKRRQKSHTKC
jgi:hypothetical protein